MAVEKVSQREIVEIYYRTPEGEDKIHPALGKLPKLAY